MVYITIELVAHADATCIKNMCVCVCLSCVCWGATHISILYENIVSPKILCEGNFKYWFFRRQCLWIFICVMPIWFIIIYPRIYFYMELNILHKRNSSGGAAQWWPHLICLFIEYDALLFDVYYTRIYLRINYLSPTNRRIFVLQTKYINKCAAELFPDVHTHKQQSYICEINIKEIILQRDSYFVYIRM